MHDNFFNSLLRLPNDNFTKGCIQNITNYFSGKYLKSSQPTTMRFICGEEPLKGFSSRSYVTYDLAGVKASQFTRLATNQPAIIRKSSMIQAFGFTFPIIICLDTFIHIAADYHFRVVTLLRFNA